ncbi:hypothetical protein CQ019_16760 [Arthrobacter sp. MYb229]|nr:hypothetical protein CQ019_16760 [Arthrobacter sp. MYb229]PRB47586.1 hypothetical protein CQ013_16785 [Arthrobacter sp. MYb216]
MLDSIIAIFALIVTILTALYSVWWPSIRSAINEPNRGTRGGVGSQYAHVLGLLRAQVMPLAVVSLMTTIALLPVIFSEVIFKTLESLDSNGLSVRLYDPLQALFVIVYLFSIYLTYLVVRLLIEISAKGKSLKNKLSEFPKTT